MMLGVGKSVKNIMNEEAFDLVEKDFSMTYFYELVAKKTKDMNVYEFYDFSPKVFHLIRQMYGIDSEDYLKSLGPENLIGNLLMGNISSLKE
jgi:1-phosphatidylinositol-4-phosphate 5-kinase